MVARRREIVLDCATLLALLVLSLSIRWTGVVETPVGRAEGIRLEQLLLLSAGYKACTEVFCNQGPLALQIMHPLFELSGRTIAGARANALLASLVGLIAVYAIARTGSSRFEAVLVVLLLTASPIYLETSLIAYSEMPALAFGLVGVALAAMYGRGGSALLLLVAAASFALSLLIKPIAVTAAAPAALFALSRRAPFAPGALALAVGLGAGIVVFGALSIGLENLWEQLLFRWRSTQIEREQVGLENLWRLAGGLKREGLGLLVLASIGAGLLGQRTRRYGAALLGWLLLSVALLVVYAPWRDKHLVIVAPPLALLAAPAVAYALRWMAQFARRASTPDLRQRVIGFLSSIACVAYVVALPSALASELPEEQLRTPSARLENRLLTDAGASLAIVTSPGNIVLTDASLAAFLANRPVPPRLVEISSTRIRAGALSESMALAESARHRPEAALIWREPIHRLPALKRWIEEEFRVLKVYALGEESRTLYVRPDADASGWRPYFEGSAPTRATALFGDRLELSSWGVRDADGAPEEPALLTIVWSATQPLSRNASATLQLRDGASAVWTSRRMPLLGNGDAQRTWASGRWIVWTTPLPIPRASWSAELQLWIQASDTFTGPLLPLTRVGDQPVVPNVDAFQFTSLRLR